LFVLAHNLLLLLPWMCPDKRGKNPQSKIKERFIPGVHPSNVTTGVGIYSLPTGLKGDDDGNNSRKG
jgi:hypothetical protein